MNNSPRPNFSSCPLTPLLAVATKLLQHFICDCSVSERWIWHNAAKYPLWLRYWLNTHRLRLWWDRSHHRVLPDRYLSLSLLFHSELTLGPTVEREQHLKVGIVKIVFASHHCNKTWHPAPWLDSWHSVTCYVSHVMNGEWSQLAWLQIET